ncbi:hypothetical protein [Leptolyngbya sp. NIES-2104]|uniref:hypothetical protein n=1 Tax=Leptolyngbya sp. NIES-2104 TaxID=1552121 RepID=UPI0006EC9AFE|nr:hypothetical protein [Leptolyngbya sp. NIES-2104]GAP94956.1 hypothetical protein NIES2104_14750 [Leptolyngbya sp. NIES-2104]
MGVQLIPALEGYDKYYFSGKRSRVDWKTIPHQIEKLDAIAKQLGVATITSFTSITRDDAVFDEAEIAEFEAESEFINGAWYYQGSLLWSIEPQWTASEVGLVTVRALLGHIYSPQQEFDIGLDDEQKWDEEQDNRGVINELKAMERILSQGQQENKRFRMCLSM